MPRGVSSTRGARTLAVLLAGLVALLLLASCGSGPEPKPEVTPATASPATATQPAPWDTSSPESAVGSYLRWVSYSYLMANSDIPTATMTPDEGIRVDAYIQLNRQQNRAIEQLLTSFRVLDVDIAEPTATVTAAEEWRYRYFALDTLTYTSESLAASYETTYTVLRQPDGRWLVDSVEATSSVEVQ